MKIFTKNRKNPRNHCGFKAFIWQVAPIKISTVFLVFSMVSAFLARFLELAASYCWSLLCNQKRYCGFYGIWCGLHDSVNDLHFDGFPVCAVPVINPLALHNAGDWGDAVP